MFELRRQALQQKWPSHDRFGARRTAATSAAHSIADVAATLAAEQLKRIGGGRMLRRILLLLGETASSISARQYALRLAQGTKAGIAGLTGIDLPYLEAPMPGRVGASAYATRLHKTLKEQADALAQRLRETFEAECRAEGIASESLTFEGDPIAVLCSSAETHDLIVTGHDTAFRGKFHEPLSDMLSKLLLITPRPMIVCPDELGKLPS